MVSVKRAMNIFKKGKTLKQTVSSAKKTNKSKSKKMDQKSKRKTTQKTTQKQEKKHKKIHKTTKTRQTTKAMRKKVTAKTKAKTKKAMRTKKKQKTTKKKPSKKRITKMGAKKKKRITKKTIKAKTKKRIKAKKAKALKPKALRREKTEKAIVKPVVKPVVRPLPEEISQEAVPEKVVEKTVVKKQEMEKPIQKQIQLVKPTAKEEKPYKDVKIVNIVVSTSLGRDVPLERMAASFSNTEYNPEQFPGLVFRIRDPKTSALIFSSGRVVCTGAKSMEKVRESIQYIIKSLAKLGVEITIEPEINVQNIVAAGSIGMDLNLNLLAMNLENTEYEPEQFPGLVYKLLDAKATFLLFRNGKIVCTGTKSEEEVHQAIELLVKKLKSVQG